MNKILLAIVNFMVMVSITACDSGVDWQDKPYQVMWIDHSSNRTLNCSVGDGGSVRRVSEEVIAVGSNESYIVAKQKDPTDSTISYFYVERTKDSKYKNMDQITKGPLTEQEFDKLKSDLGFPEFSKEF